MYFYNDTVDRYGVITTTFNNLNFSKIGQHCVWCKTGDTDILTLTVAPMSTCLMLKFESFSEYSTEYLMRSFNADDIVKCKRKHDLSTSKAIENVQNLNASDPSSRVQACLENNIPYVDLEFPPNDDSVGTDVPYCGWLKPREFLKNYDTTTSDYDLILSEIKPNDIDQGSLGDCWFLCAMACIAEFPDKVIKTFRHPGGSKKAHMEMENGAVLILVRHNGWSERIYVDTYVPVNVLKPCFAKNIEEPG